MLVLKFVSGSLELRLKTNCSEELQNIPALVRSGLLVWDSRALCYRAWAFHYRSIVEHFQAQKIQFEDCARQFRPVHLPLIKSIEPRLHQSEALSAWLGAGARGVVVLPTGAGKTILAVLAIAKLNRPSIVHVPTLDLVEQWKTVLHRFFGRAIGCVGGGSQTFAEITVITYDSAARMVPFRGADFGLAIFDECHHLPSEFYKLTAQASLAPFRLGLTATPEPCGERASLSDEILGPVCYESRISDLAGATLAPYEVHTLAVQLNDAERQEYDSNRNEYLAFVQASRIDFRRAGGWQDFIRAAARSEKGRAAFRAYLKQKRISMRAAAKMDTLHMLMHRHAQDQILIFTHDNWAAYQIGQAYALPVITHLTHASDRIAFLEAFRAKELGVLVTARVLNEGVDVPEANIGIVVSGTGTVREHVQRLGRILRASAGKKARLYEIVTAETAEEHVSNRRRQHDAYQ